MPWRGGRLRRAAPASASQSAGQGSHSRGRRQRTAHRAPTPPRLQKVPNWLERARRQTCDQAGDARGVPGPAQAAVSAHCACWSMTLAVHSATPLFCCADCAAADLHDRRIGASTADGARVEPVHQAGHRTNQGVRGCAPCPCNHHLSEAAETPRHISCTQRRHALGCAGLDVRGRSADQRACRHTRKIASQSATRRSSPFTGQLAGTCARRSWPRTHEEGNGVITTAGGMGPRRRTKHPAARCRAQKPRPPPPARPPAAPPARALRTSRARAAQPHSRQWRPTPAASTTSQRLRRRPLPQAAHCNHDRDVVSHAPRGTLPR